MASNKHHERWIYSRLLCIAVLWHVMVHTSLIDALPKPDLCLEAGHSKLCDEFRIDAIVIDGHSRTQRMVFERELLFAEGDVVTMAMVEESVQRIRNTGLFRRVDYAFNQPFVASTHDLTGQGLVEPGRVLKITVDERWTILPAVRFERGGNAGYLLLGIQDANFLGRYLHLGLQYERLADAHSMTTYFRNPRFLDQRLLFGLDVAYTNRVFTFYDNSGELDGGFLMTRHHIGALLDKEWQWWLRTSLSLSYFQEEYSYSLVDDRVRHRQRQIGGLPNGTHNLGVSATLRLGRLNYDNYLIDGGLFSIRMTRQQGINDQSPSITRMELGAQHYWSLPLKSTAAIRASLGVSDADQIHHLYYIGGLDAVRGFLSMRFRGRHYWLSNAEYRIPSVDTRWLVLQHIAFMDAAGVSPYYSQLFDLTAASAGIGIRVISPMIYGLVMRFDYAFPMHGGQGPAFSFGAQQFF